MGPQQIAIVDAWRSPEAEEFFRRVWPLYLHDISAFDTDFYALDQLGRWLPDIVGDWIASATPAQNLRTQRASDDPAQPFQRTHVITSDGRAVGFICVGKQPFAYMPNDVDYSIAELFLIHAARGTGAAARALELLLARYPGGRWYLSAIHDNARAVQFWRKALGTVGASAIDERRENRDITWRFVSARTASFHE